MAAFTEAAHAVAHEPHDEVKHVRMNRLGLWLFFASDGLVFALLLSARFYMNGTDTAPDVKQWLGLIITSVLLISSYTAYRGETALHHGNVAHGRLMLMLTILLGVGFFAGVVMEWSIAEFTVSEGYGTSFFSMTGMHAAHVASGVLLLFLAWRKAGKGYYDGGGLKAYGVSGVVMYWHFVDVVWVFFYPALYLIK
ncbi:MAG: cytochrome c oxidase subunit 3 [Dehalococcoidia bacterium]|nr:cytochrome c oxidase subunit 3 [Dehalococcoidia bacterium]